MIDHINYVFKRKLQNFQKKIKNEAIRSVQREGAPSLRKV